MIKEITSPKNKMVCDLKKLKTKKYREQSGTFLAEGYRNVCDSMEKKAPKLILLEKNFQEPVSLPEGVEVYRVSEEILKEICDTKTPQGIAAVFEIPKEKEISVHSVLLLNGVSDPGNLGTILRTALAAGFTDIILDEQCADAYAPKVVRSAMSAIFSLNLIRVKNLAEPISDLQQKGIQVYGAALSDSAESLYETSFSEDVALLFGSEANGISEELLALCDCLYIIPMQEEIESLNVAVAAGISMYEVLRRKKY